MMTFLPLLLINVFISFFLSWVLVKYGKKDKKFISLFADAPWKYDDKILISKTIKFQAEYALSLFLVPGALVMLAVLSYVLSRPLPGIDQVEFFFMCFIGEFIVVLGTAMMVQSTFETVYQERDLREKNGNELYLTESGIYFPIAPLEGSWREIARKAQKDFLFLKYDSIKELQVEPQRGSYLWPKPPYYKIALKDCPMNVFVRRNQFYGLEKHFLDKISAKTTIIYNDQLRD